MHICAVSKLSIRRPSNPLVSFPAVESCSIALQNASKVNIEVHRSMTQEGAEAGSTVFDVVTKPASRATGDVATGNKGLIDTIMQ